MSSQQCCFFLEQWFHMGEKFHEHVTLTSPSPFDRKPLENELVHLVPKSCTYEKGRKDLSSYSCKTIKCILARDRITFFVEGFRANLHQKPLMASLNSKELRHLGWREFSEILLRFTGSNELHKDICKFPMDHGSTRLTRYPGKLAKISRISRPTSSRCLILIAPWSM